MDLILAFSLQDQVEKYGAYVGLAAFIGLAVLSLLYFAQARELKRLRDWAGRAPERAQELQERVSAQAEESLREAEPEVASGTVGPAQPIAAPAGGNGRQAGAPIPIGPRPAVAMAAVAASAAAPATEALTAEGGTEVAAPADEAGVAGDGSAAPPGAGGDGAVSSRDDTAGGGEDHEPDASPDTEAERDGITGGEIAAAAAAAGAVASSRDGEGRDEAPVTPSDGEARDDVGAPPAGEETGEEPVVPSVEETGEEPAVPSVEETGEEPVVPAGEGAAPGQPVSWPADASDREPVTSPADELAAAEAAGAGAVSRPDPARSGNGVPAEPPATIPRATPRPQPTPRPAPAAAPLRASTTRSTTLPPPRRRLERGGDSRAGLYTLIGILVLAIAIFVPVYFMVLSSDETEPPPNTTADPGVTPGADGGAGQAAAAVRPEKVVVVLNGTAIDGLASGQRDKLMAAGYADGMIRIDNSDDQSRQDSIVLYAPEERRQARDVARLLDISRIEAIDEETQALADSSDESGTLPADVVVTLGTDVAP